MRLSPTFSSNGSIELDVFTSLLSNWQTGIVGYQFTIHIEPQSDDYKNLDLTIPPVHISLLFNHLSPNILIKHLLPYHSSPSQPASSPAAFIPKRNPIQPKTSQSLRNRGQDNTTQHNSHPQSHKDTYSPTSSIYQHAPNAH